MTVSTSGLTADAGAEGAVQVQFVTKRGTNTVHWQAFEQFRHDALNSNTWLNSVRGLPKPRLRLNEWGGNIGGPLRKGKLFYFANFEQPIQPSDVTFTRTLLNQDAQRGMFRYSATDGSVRAVNLLDIARSNGFPSAIDRLHRFSKPRRLIFSRYPSRSASWLQSSCGSWWKRI